MAQKNKKEIKPSASGSDLTPLMSQYRGIKAAHPDYIVFFRLGDFYEMFDDDAVAAAPLLGVVLTRRQDVPMCGVPHHSAANYIKTLLAAGKKIALCEQSESSENKKLMTREVVRLITPGTVWEENLLGSGQNNYVVAVLPLPDGGAAMAAADITASDCWLLQSDSAGIDTEMAKIMPKEIVAPSGSAKDIESRFGTLALVSSAPDWHFDEDYALSRMTETAGVKTWSAIDPDGHPAARRAMGGLISYLDKIHFSDVGKVVSMASFKRRESFLMLDASAMRTLEIVANMRDAGPSGTLLEICGVTRTPMGARLIKKNLLEPSASSEEISRRHDAVEFFVEDSFVRGRLRDKLSEIGDIERILTRITAKSATPREIWHLGNSLKSASGIKKILSDGTSRRVSAPEFVVAAGGMLDDLSDVTAEIEAALVPEPPPAGFVLPGYDSALDEFKKLADDARGVILELERREKERTGINSLKIGYNSVTGYFIEITKTNLSSVPQEYSRKQTLANAERFVIPQLAEIERKILYAAQKSEALEKEILAAVREKICSRKKEILSVAAALAALDVYSSFAETAASNRWVRPGINDSGVIDIKDLRHPVVEKRLKSGQFVPNDVRLDPRENQIIVLTGPNMAGKSTYLRQTALCIVLAQAGSFVPAKSAVIGVVDRIFTRIGSADNLAGGESTFMVEMTETAAIMRGMTPRSLVILDEVGRGTSTFDGISIAWAIIEYLHAAGDPPRAGPKVLFATHYFELTELAEKLGRVKNFSVDVSEWKNEVIFLYKIIPGAADRSYGIHVAKLAGMPAQIIDRGKKILSELQSHSHDILKKRTSEDTRGGQMDFEDFLIFDKLKNVDVNTMTPIEALNVLSEIAALGAERKKDGNGK